MSQVKGTVSRELVVYVHFTILAWIYPFYLGIRKYYIFPWLSIVQDWVLSSWSLSWTVQIKTGTGRNSSINKLLIQKCTQEQKILPELSWVQRWVKLNYVRDSAESSWELRWGESRWVLLYVKFSFLITFLTIIVHLDISNTDPEPTVYMYSILVWKEEFHKNGD